MIYILSNYSILLSDKSNKYDIKYEENDQIIRETRAFNRNINS